MKLQYLGTDSKAARRTAEIVFPGADILTIHAIEDDFLNIYVTE